MIQYIKDRSGEAAVHIQIPVAEWENLKKKYKGIESNLTTTSEYHKNIVRRRTAYYNKHPELLIPLDEFFIDLDKDTDAE